MRKKREHERRNDATLEMTVDGVRYTGKDGAELAHKLKAAGHITIAKNGKAKLRKRKQKRGDKDVLVDRVVTTKVKLARYWPW